MEVRAKHHINKAIVEVFRSTVTSIQTKLTILGYKPGPADGVMGKRTKSAILSFQNSTGTKTDGQPSKSLLTKLDEAVSGKSISSAKVVPSIFRKGPIRPDDIAVIIGNSNYRKLGRSIPNVTPAYADAEGIKRYFTRALGIREGNIIHLKDATKAQLTSVFGSNDDHRGRLFNWTKPNVSKVYVYYAGHGAPAGEPPIFRWPGFRCRTFFKPLSFCDDLFRLSGHPGG